MKKILLFVSSLFIMHAAYAQDYIPLVNEGSHWLVSMDDDQDLMEYLWEYHINGDTIINNTEYKKVYTRGLLVGDAQPPFASNEPYHVIAAIRENIAAKKVYSVLFEFITYNDCPVGSESLLYDFSLMPNDALDFCLYEGYGDDVLSEIIEMDMFGISTKAFQSNTFHEYYEGIGSQNGLFEAIFHPVKSTDAEPYPELYSYCPTNNCDLLLSQNEAMESNRLSLFPNPATNFLIFTLPANTTKAIIKIYNIYGEQIKELVSNNNKIQWNLENTSSGVYFYQAEINGEDYRGKLIIE